MGLSKEVGVGIAGLVIVVALSMLGGCAGQTASVDNAGITTIDFSYDENGKPKLHAVTGKDYDSLEAEIDVTAGKGYIKAEKASGLEGQKAAAMVEARFAEFYENATPAVQSVLTELLKTVLPLLGK